jgi:hypothetical protein
MYPEIKKEIEEGKILLEWDKKKGPSPLPILKEKYGELRRNAKNFNFYFKKGKSNSEFSKDWNCSLQEASVNYIIYRIT